MLLLHAHELAVHFSYGAVPQANFFLSLSPSHSFSLLSAARSRALSLSYIGPVVKATVEHFKKTFGADPEIICIAPGRVNLIGLVCVCVCVCANNSFKHTHIHTCCIYLNDLPPKTQHTNPQANIQTTTTALFFRVQSTTTVPPASRLPPRAL